MKDHLGSTRVAFVPVKNGAEVVQETTYYTFGAPIGALSWNKSVDNKNPFLREGKEYIGEYGWGKYDFMWRTFDSWIIQALQVDPMAEKYYGISPYAIWANNPMRFVDPDGRQTWPATTRQAMGHDNYILAHQGATRLLKEQVRGSANSVLLLLGVAQIITGQIASNFTNNGKSPEWSVPLQWNQNDQLELKHSWKNETLSCDDGKEVMKNTIGAILLFIPFSNAATGIERNIENTFISTFISTTIDAGAKISSKKHSSLKNKTEEPKSTSGEINVNFDELLNPIPQFPLHEELMQKN